MEDETKVLALRRTDLLTLSTAGSTLEMLKALPDRLDDEQFALVRQIARAPVPELPRIGSEAFAKAMKMLDTLPRRRDDADSGELRYRVYEIGLRDLPAKQIWWTVEEAIRERKFCPSVREFRDLAKGWVRQDEALEVNRLARRLAASEINARHLDSLPKPPDPPPLTQEQVDAMTPEFINLGLKTGALIKDETGKVVVNPEPTQREPAA